MEPTQGTWRVVDTKVYIHLSSDTVLPTWCLCVLGYYWWPWKSSMVHSSRDFLSWSWPRGAWSHRQTDAVYYHRKDRPSQNDRYFSFSLAWSNNKALSQCFRNITSSLSFSSFSVCTAGLGSCIESSVCLSVRHLSQTEGGLFHLWRRAE